MSPASVCLLWLAVGAPTCAHADIRALLIGVSGYPTLSPRLRLEGPRNDVPRIRQVLIGRGLSADRITMLADQVPGAALPTRDNILGSLDRLQATIERGDIVILFFAGHGSRQPAGAASPPEADHAPAGWNSTILPIDIGRWDGQMQRVENAIRDDELRARVEQITKKGAFVWAIFDACYSGGLVRGQSTRSDGSAQYHYVDPGELGIPANAASLLATPVETTRGSATPADSAVFFYAAQIDEVTPDLSLPAGDPHAERHGLFSFALARALESDRPMTYRQLSQMILAQYAELNGVRVTPLFTGGGLDHPVLGQSAPAVQQWPLYHGVKLTVPVGTLSDVNEGAILGVFSGPLAPANGVIGYVQVTRAEPAYSEVKPTSFAKAPELGIADFKAGQFVRLVQSPPRFQLRVAVDSHRCGWPCRVSTAIQQLQSAGVAGVDVRWVNETDHPDFIMDARADRVRFIAADTPRQTNDNSSGAVGFPIPDRAPTLVGTALADKIADTLHNIARSRNILRLAGDQTLRMSHDGITTTVKHLPVAGRAVQTVSPEVIPTLHNGDRLVVTLHNDRRVPMDVTLLWADSQYGITRLFPDRRGDTNRIGAGDTVVVDDIHIVSTDSRGREHLLVIAIEARRMAEHMDLSFLEQPRLALTRNRRHDEPVDLLPFLDAGFADYRTRGALLPETPTSDTFMQVFAVDVQP